MNAAQLNMYQLAENLGMTVTRMAREMTMSEYFGWLAFYAQREDLENKPRKPKAPSQRPGGGITMKGFDL